MGVASIASAVRAGLARPMERDDEGTASWSNASLSWMLRRAGRIGRLCCVKGGIGLWEVDVGFLERGWRLISIRDRGFRGYLQVRICVCLLGMKRCDVVKCFGNMCNHLFYIVVVQAQQFSYGVGAMVGKEILNLSY